MHRIHRASLSLIVIALGVGCCRSEDGAHNGPMAKLAKLIHGYSEVVVAVYLPVPADPTVSFSLWFKVGSQNDPLGKEGLAYLTAQLLADGSTKDKSYEEILKALKPMASNYTVTVDREMTTFTGRTHLDNVDAYYDLYEAAFLQPAFTEEDFDRIKSNTLDFLQKTLRYASDEELGKAALYQAVFEGTSYRHPQQGTVTGLQSITLDDVRTFYAKHFTRKNVTTGMGGGYSDELTARLASSVAQLPDTDSDAMAPPSPKEIDGLNVTLIQKPDADASISFGYPIDVHRGDRDFYALWLAVSWLGEHRNSSSHLYNVIRETRGMNYGDYAYIEAYPGGGVRQKPPWNVGRQSQLFEVWIRTLPNEQAHFALRAAMRELKKLVDNGLTQEEFERTRSFLSKYILHFADTTSARLGYAIDDVFYDIDGNHLENFRETISDLTLDEVNAAIKKHLQYDNVRIAMVTGQAEELKTALSTDAPSPMTYGSDKPAEVLEEDKEIEAFPLDIDEANIEIIEVEAFLQE